MGIHVSGRFGLGPQAVALTYINSFLISIHVADSGKSACEFFRTPGTVMLSTSLSTGCSAAQSSLAGASSAERREAPTAIRRESLYALIKGVFTTRARTAGSPA